MSDSLVSLPWSNNSDRKPMTSRRDFTKVASVAAGSLFLSSDGGSQETRALVSGNPATVRSGFVQNHRTSLSGGSAVDVEKLAARVAGALLFALAAFVAITSIASLLGYSEPKPTHLGIAILVAAAAVMPWLAKEKRRLSGATGSAALRADAAQSALCAYLSLIALAGLAINAIWHVKWADPVAALAVLPLIVWEGREAMRGKACGCHLFRPHSVPEECGNAKQKGQS
jgi:hypothetical protein